MTDPRNPDHSFVDDDVEGHDYKPGRVQPSRDESGDVHGHSHGAKPPTKDEPDAAATDEDDVEGHIRVKHEDHSPQG